MTRSKPNRKMRSGLAKTNHPAPNIEQDSQRATVESIPVFLPTATPPKKHGLLLALGLLAWLSCVAAVLYFAFA